MILLVMADLEMLVLDKTQFDTYGNQFFERFDEIVSVYDKWVKESDTNWLFSDNLIDLLTESFPWNAKDTQRLNKFRSVFFRWLRQVRARIKFVKYDRLKWLELDPNIHADYVTTDYPDLDNEWRNVLANHGEVDSKATVVIFSFAGKPNQVTLIDPNSNTRKTFPLVKNEPEWLTELKKIDPWLRHQLPKSGDYPYEPPDPKALDFPQEYYPPRDAKGFKDNKGRLWVPDEERGQRHWDVQCEKRGRDKYFKVSPDGRLLEGKPC